MVPWKGNREVGSGGDSAGYCGTHPLYAWPRALVVKVWTCDVMGWIGSEAGVGSRFWCERAQGLGLVAGVQQIEDTEYMCVISYRI